MPKPERSASSRKCLYDAIEAAMKAFPDMRVGQLIDNAIAIRPNLFYVEDDALTQRIYEYISTHQG